MYTIDKETYCGVTGSAGAIVILPPGNCFPAIKGVLRNASYKIQ